MQLLQARIDDSWLNYPGLNAKDADESWNLSHITQLYNRFAFLFFVAVKVSIGLFCIFCVFSFVGVVKFNGGDLLTICKDHLEVKVDFFQDGMEWPFVPVRISAELGKWVSRFTLNKTGALWTLSKIKSLT